eukprot:gene12293-5876_t
MQGTKREREDSFQNVSKIIKSMSNITIRKHNFPNTEQLLNVLSYLSPENYFSFILVSKKFNDLFFNSIYSFSFKYQRLLFLNLNYFDYESQSHLLVELETQNKKKKLELKRIEMESFLKENWEQYQNFSSIYTEKSEKEILSMIETLQILSWEEDPIEYYDHIPTKCHLKINDNSVYIGTEYTPMDSHDYHDWLVSFNENYEFLVIHFSCGECGNYTFEQVHLKEISSKLSINLTDDEIIDFFNDLIHILLGFPFSHLSTAKKWRESAK